MITFKVDEFAGEGILREKDFLKKMETHDWSQYDGKVVMIQGCSDIFIPQWPYLIAAVRLSQHAKKLTFGELRNQIPIHLSPEYAKAQKAGEVDPEVES